MYKMFVRLHLDYCGVIYHIPPPNNEFDSSIRLNPLMESLGEIQYQAAISRPGCWQGISLNNICEEFGWETTPDRRWARCVTHFFKIFHNDSLPDLKEHVPLPRNKSYCFQNEVKCRTSKYMNSFFPNCVKAWNNIDENIQNCDTISK